MAEPRRDLSSRTALSRLNLSLGLFIIGMSLRAYSTAGLGVLPYSQYETGLVRNIGFGFLAFSFTLAIMEGRASNFQKKYLLWLRALGLLLLGLTAYGVFRGNDLPPLGYDLASFSFLSALLVGGKRENWKTLDRMLLMHLAAGTVASIYALATFPLSLNRALLVESAAYRTMDMLYPWPYFLLTFHYRGFVRRLVAGAGVSAFIINTMIFQKRAQIGELLLYGLLAILFYVVKMRSQHLRVPTGLIRAALFGAIIVIVLFGALRIVDPGGIFLEATEALKNRFYVTDEGERLTADEAFTWSRYMGADRYRESEEFLDQASISDLVIGYGIGGMFWTPIIGDTYFHIGLTQLVLKGGIILLAGWLLGCGILFQDFLSQAKRIKEEFLCCYGIVMVYALFLILNWAWAIHTGFGLILMCGGACMSKWISSQTSNVGAIHHPAIATLEGESAFGR